MGSEDVRREQFSLLQTLPTRWDDNDVYGHLNNAKYYAFFDTAINNWLIAKGKLDPAESDVIGFCAESSCKYLAPLGYPQPVEAALRVGHLGRSSVRYELALFDQKSPTPAATGTFVHVFVDRDTQKPTPIPPQLREALVQLQTEDRPA